MTTQELVALTERVNRMIGDVRNGCPSQYFTFYLNEDDKVTIRVSNHKANPHRIDGKTIIFVLENNGNEDREDDDSTSFSINEKSFSNVPGQYLIDDNNDDENGHDIEYILDYELN